MKKLKYQKIKEDIVDKIQSSEYKPNQILPSESQLCKFYDVSRITVRKALDELIYEDIIYSIKGKGSFVKENPLDGLSRVHSFTEAINLQNKETTKKVIEFKIIDVDEKTKNKMKLGNKDKVYLIKTLYFADKEPYCVNTSILPVKLFEKLDFFDLNNNSLYQTLINFYKLSHTRANQTLEATVGNAYINNILELPKEKPLLKINGTSYGMINGNEVVFEIYESYIITDYSGYYVEK